MAAQCNYCCMCAHKSAAHAPSGIESLSSGAMPSAKPVVVGAVVAIFTQVVERAMAGNLWKL